MKIILLFIFHCKPLICHNSGSQVLDQNAHGQSDCMILWNVTSQERSEGKVREVDFLHVDKHQSILKVDTIF